MASTVIFDLKDPGVEEMARGWADNEEYPIPPMRIRQTGRDKNQVRCDIVQVDAGEAVLDDEGPPAKPPPSKQTVPISYRK